jgi:peptide/nickel transport system substrate-binding protein
MPTSVPSGAPSAPGKHRRALVAGFLAVATLGAVSACDNADAANTAPEPAKGGTLRVNIQGGIDLLDPQRTYAALDMNVLRLTTRTLTTYASTQADASAIVPDLATDTGRPSENNTVWKFTLKPGVKWEGGEPVTCSQVKHGIERRFSPLMDEGAPYPKDYLQDNAKPYEGPWLDGNNDGKGLESIRCLDERNIQFTLRRPVGDFGYALALTTFAPVLPEKDNQLDYANRPYSNGPYKIESRSEDELVLVRNNFWNETNDQVRKAYPDKIVMDFRQDEAGALTNELIENQGEARNTIMIDSNVAPNFLQQVANDPELIKRTVSGPTGGVRWMAINMRRIPELKCRQALIYAFNKRKWRTVAGGSVIGDYATTIIPEGFKAHKDFDIYDSLANTEGNPEKTEQLMNEQAAAGQPCKSKIRIGFRDLPVNKRPINTVVEAYQAAGIEVDAVAVPSQGYYTTGIGDPNNDYDMVLVGWIPDWANGSAILPPLFASSNIPAPDPLTGKASGNVNWSLLESPEIDQQMDLALAETSPDRQWALWGDIDEQLARLATTIPILYEKAFRLSGSNIAGGFVHPAFGMPDLAALGLVDPSL